MTNPIAKCAELAGTLSGAQIVHRLFYWQPKSKITRDGKVWVVFSRDRWQEETGLSRNQFDRALARLKSRGIVEAETHLFNNVTRSFIRLRVALEEGPGFLKSENTGFLESEKTNNKEIRKEIIKETVCTESRANGKTASSAEGFSEGDDRVKAKDVLLALSQKEGATKPNTVKDREVRYKTCMSEKHGHVMVHLTQKQRGQLGQFLKRCPKGEASKVFQKVLDDWNKFTAEVEYDAGLKKTPLEPHIGFILVHANAAIKYALPKAPKPVPVKPVAYDPPPKIIPKKVVQDDPMPTLAEILAPPTGKQAVGKAPASDTIPKQYGPKFKIGKKSS